MLLDPLAARILLVVHTALAVAAVGAATHAVLWLRRYCRRIPNRRVPFASTYRFIRLALLLHSITFVVGNLMYPTYKVNVRMAYLDNPVAVADDFEHRQLQQQRAQSFLRNSEAPIPLDATALAQQQVSAAQRMARWFDVKEHLLVFGLIAWAGTWWITRRWARSPTHRADKATEAVVVCLAYFATATLWLAAIIGVLTAAWRAI